MLIFKQYKGNILCTADAILTKLDTHQRIKVIYIHIKFRQIPLVSYLVMAADGRDTDGHGENYEQKPGKRMRPTICIVFLIFYSS